MNIGINSIDKLNQKYDTKSIEKLIKSNYLFPNIFKIKFQSEINIITISQEYKKDPNVEYAEPNFIFDLCSEPNDPYYNKGYQWALNQNNDFDIDAPEAWEINSGSSDIIIAVLDTGADYMKI